MAQDIFKARIAARIAALERERDGFQARANQQMAYYQGAIDELRKLLESESPPPAGDCIAT